MYGFFRIPYHIATYSLYEYVSHVCAGSICGTWLVTRHRAFDSSCSCMTSCDGCTLDLVDEVGREFTDVMFTVTNQLQQLRLTDDETSLIEAYVIFDGRNIVIIV